MRPASDTPAVEDVGSGKKGNVQTQGESNSCTRKERKHKTNKRFAKTTHKAPSCPPLDPPTFTRLWGGENVRQPQFDSDPKTCMERNRTSCAANWRTRQIKHVVMREDQPQGAQRYRRSAHHTGSKLKPTNKKVITIVGRDSFEGPKQKGKTRAKGGAQAHQY